MTTKGYTKWQQLNMDQCHKWCAIRIGTWPPLFILYVNDITDGVQSTLEMFADDSKLYRNIHNQHDTEILQRDLDFISN